MPFEPVLKQWSIVIYGRKKRNWTIIITNINVRLWKKNILIDNINRWNNQACILKTYWDFKTSSKLIKKNLIYDGGISDNIIHFNDDIHHIGICIQKI